MSGLQNAMKIQAAMMLGSRAKAKVGLVSATRADMYAVKVTLQPEDVETGWLPVLSPFVGNGWGLCAKLIQNSQVVVLYQEDDLSNGIVIGAMFSVPDQPPSSSMNDGEFWMVHQSGSLLKFTNDGKVALTSHSDLNITCGGKLAASASEFDLTGNLKVSGDVHATGTVTGDTDVKAGPTGISSVNHEHSGVTSGIGISGPPVP